MENNEWDYCPVCDKHVHTEYDTFSTIAQYGVNVYSREFCAECGHLIREKLIDENI